MSMLAYILGHVRASWGAAHVFNGTVTRNPLILPCVDTIDICLEYLHRMLGRGGTLPEHSVQLLHFVAQAFSSCPSCTFIHLSVPPSVRPSIHPSVHSINPWVPTPCAEDDSGCTLQVLYCGWSADPEGDTFQYGAIPVTEPRKWQRRGPAKDMMDLQCGMEVVGGRNVEGSFCGILHLCLTSTS